jgi:hypothetical protein
MASKYEIFPLFLLVHTERTGCILPLKSANLGVGNIGLTTGLHSVTCMRTGAIAGESESFVAET